MVHAAVDLVTNIRAGEQRILGKLGNGLQGSQDTSMAGLRCTIAGYVTCLHLLVPYS